MKRSLTIGCVLLVGGGVANCGGSAELGSRISDGQGGASAGAGAIAGSGPYVGGGGSDCICDAIGTPMTHAGSAGAAVGVCGAAPGTCPEIGVGGAAPGTGPEIGVGGAADWDTAGEGGTAGSNEQPPAVGTAPLAGAGGVIGVPA